MEVYPQQLSPLNMNSEKEKGANMAVGPQCSFLTPTVFALGEPCIPCFPLSLALQVLTLRALHLGGM